MVKRTTSGVEIVDDANNTSSPSADNGGIDANGGANDSAVIELPKSINGIPVVDAASVERPVEKRGRGRPAGTTKKPAVGAGKSKAAPVSVVGIEKILLSAHMMLAKFTTTPEFELDESEAKLLAGAVAEVSSHYDVIVDPKIIAWVGLAGMCGSIYAPRIAAIKMRKQSEPKKQRAEPQVDISQDHFSPPSYHPYQ